MDRQQFGEVLEREFNALRELNGTKGKEYSGDEDALRNFKEVARACGITPQQALMTYATKHWQAINSYVKNGRVYSEPIQGRLRDLVLYGLLMIALVEEEEQQAKKDTVYVSPAMRIDEANNAPLPRPRPAASFRREGE